MQTRAHFIHEEPAMRWEDGIPLEMDFLEPWFTGILQKKKFS